MPTLFRLQPSALIALILCAWFPLVAAGCGQDPAPDGGRADDPPRGVRPQAAPRPAHLPERAADAMREDGPYRLFDRERRRTARDVAWLLLKVGDHPSVSLQQTTLDLVSSLKGVSFGHLEQFFRKLGLESIVAEESLESFTAHKTPGILAMTPVQPGMPDWACSMILYRGETADGKLLITDPLSGAHAVERAWLAERYRGAALRLAPPAVAVGPPASPMPTVPDIGLEELRYDYGRVDSGTLVRRTFRIFNRGGRPLQIIGIRPSCGCMGAPLHEKGAKVSDPTAEFKRNPDTGIYEVDFGKRTSSTLLPPAGETYVTGFYDTTNRIGFMPSSFTLISNDPDEREVTLFMSGVVRRVAEYDPPVIHWRAIRSAEGAEGLVWIRAVTGKPFAIRSVRVNIPEVEVAAAADASREPGSAAGLPAKLRPRPHPAQEGWQAIRVRVRRGLRAGPFNGIVRVASSLSDSPLAFGVWGVIAGNIQVEPAAPTFGRVALGVQKIATLRLTSSLGAAFEVTAAKVDHPKIMDVTVKCEQPGVYRVDVVLKKGWQSPSITTRVTVKTNDPIEPKKHIEVVGFVSRR